MALIYFAILLTSSGKVRHLALIIESPLTWCRWNTNILS